MANPNQSPNVRASEEQRTAMRDEMNESFRKLQKKSAGTLLGTFIAHVQSEDGRPLRDFGAMVDAVSGGLLSKAIKGIMAPDEPSKKNSGITVKEITKKH
jgi:hypothetical protein